MRAIRDDQGASITSLQNTLITIFVRGFSKRIRRYDLDCRIIQQEAFTGFNFLDVVFLPPVQANDGNLSILVGDEVRFAGFINVVLTIFILFELEQVA